jgi:hypothetical protein
MKFLFRAPFVSLARLTAVCLLATCAQAAEPLKLVVPGFQYQERPESRYFHELLELALQKTQAPGESFVIENYPAPMSGARATEEVKHNGAVNLLWNATSAERERDLLPVRISLLRELNNYRVLMIRKGEQARFDHLRTLDDLRALHAGLGTQWPDNAVFARNRLPVVNALKHADLFRMLAVKRFDYFPRGLFEVWAELAMPENHGLTMERDVMLYYRMPFYFFVNRNNTALAERIERGLRLAQADGSFDRLLQSVPNFRRALDEQRSGRRRVILLDAPPSP